MSEMARPLDERKTVDDIYSLPEGKRAELIDGVIYDLAAPNRAHQRISMSLSTLINNRIQSTGKKCEVYSAPFAVFLKDDIYNYVEPDIFVCCDPNKVQEDGCHGAPDWIIEIVSPSSRQMDYLRKARKYESAGVRLYWVVDPIDKLITAYDFERGELAHYFFGDAIPVALDPEWSIVIPKPE